MLTNSRTFRIFISSTFSDFKAERDALQRKVFPKLRKMCEGYGCRFQAIDLRWGVSEEAASDQRTVEICLEEIVRCQQKTPRPNFLVLIGNRYGWRPLPYSVPASEFAKIAESARSLEDRALLLRWYRRDDNAIPAVHRLLSRHGDETDPVAWAKTEARLRDAFRHALKEAGIPVAEWSRFFASATEHEIIKGALDYPGASESVFSYFRSIAGTPPEGMGREFWDVDEEGNDLNETRAALDDLKRRLTETLPGTIKTYQTNWEGDGISLGHIDQLCADVYADLSRKITEQLAEYKAVDPIDREIHDHRAFEKERAKSFVGREAQLTAVADYLDGRDPEPFAVHGIPGSGKSALMAKAAAAASLRYPNATVISRYIGATPASTLGMSLLEGLCTQLDREYGKEGAAPASDYESLASELSRRLAFASAEHPLVLFVDSLDQLDASDRARGLSWIPTRLPPFVRMVVSTLPGDCLSTLVGKLSGSHFVELGPLPEVERRTLLDHWLAGISRRLSPSQSALLSRRVSQCGLPLYLKLVFEEVRRWRSYDEPPEPSADVKGIVNEMFDRLSLEANHGATLVARSIGYLQAAKNGLTEDELLDLLSRDTEVKREYFRRFPKSPPIERLPVVVWSRLHADLESYLTERSADDTTTLAFYHREIGEVAAERYLRNEEGTTAHAVLASYFKSQPTWLDGQTGRIPNARKVSETPFQLTRSGLIRELYQTLTDLDFVAAKCAAGMTFELNSDYASAPSSPIVEDDGVYREAREALTKYAQALIEYARSSNSTRKAAQGKPAVTHLPFPQVVAAVPPWDEERSKTAALSKNEAPATSDLDRDALRDFALFVNSEGPVLARYGSVPGFCLQHAHNVALPGPLLDAADRRLQQAVAPTILVKKARRRERTPFPALLRCLEGHTDLARCVAVSADGSVAVSGGNDGNVMIWDPNDPSSRGKRLSGHTTTVSRIVITPDGRKAVSAGDDGTIRVWDIPAQQCLRTIEAHQGPVSCLDATADAGLAISGGDEKTLVLWDLSEGIRIRTLDPLKEKALDVALTASGTWAVSAEKGRTSYSEDYRHSTQYYTFRTWDLFLWAQTEEFECGSLEASSALIAMTPDGSRLVHGCGSDLHLWDRTSGNRNIDLIEHNEQLIHIMEKYDDRVTCAAITPDGSFAVFVDMSKTMWIVDLRSIRESSEFFQNGQFTLKWRTARCVKKLEGLTKGIADFSLTADGRRAISANGDGTVGVWDLERGTLHKVDATPTSSLPPVALPRNHRGHYYDSYSSDQLALYQMRQGEHRRSKSAHSGSVDQVIISPNARSVISLSKKDVDLRLWDFETGDLVKALIAELRDATSIHCFCLSADGKAALAGLYNLHDDDDVFRVFDLESGKMTDVRRGIEHSVDQIAITSDGRIVVTVSWDFDPKGGWVYGWDLRGHGKRRRRPRKLTSGISYRNQLTLSADGKLAINWGGSKGTVVIDLSTRRHRRLCETHHQGILYLCLAPDGATAVSCNSNHSGIDFWNIWTGTLIRHIEVALAIQAPSSFAHDVPVSIGDAFRLTPDGRRIVAIEASGDFSVWDISSGAHLLSMKDGSAIAKYLRLSPDGRIAVSEGADCLLKTWNVEKGACIAVYPLNAVMSSNISKISASGRFACGFSSGEVRALELHGCPSDSAIVTATRIWTYRGPAPRFRRCVWGFRDPQVTARCPWCGKQLIVLPETVAAIRSARSLGESVDGSTPCIGLPAAAWKAPGLDSSCTQCGGKFRYNPFIDEGPQKERQGRIYKRLTRRASQIQRERESPGSHLCDQCGGEGTTVATRLTTALIATMLLCGLVVLPFRSLWWLALSIPLGGLMVSGTVSCVLDALRPNPVCVECGRFFVPNKKPS